MSPKQWLALLCFYVSYLFFGASIFHHIEHGVELENRAEKLQERIEINGNYFHRFKFKKVVHIVKGL